MKYKNGEYLNNLRLADDIVLVGKSTDEIQKILQLYRESQKMGLEMNMKKTKIMFNSYEL